MADPGDMIEPTARVRDLVAGPDLRAAQAEFSPDELDRLEDALERWTDDLDGPVPEDSSLAAPLRTRLADYRGLLTQAREALPLEDVPDDLLAGVRAEARASTPSAPGARRREAARPGLWERLRRSMLLPGFALASSAALLLWMVQPGDAETLVVERSEATAPARLAPLPGPAPAASAPAERAPAPELAGAAEPVAPAQAPGAAAPPRAEAKAADDLKDTFEPAKADRKGAGAKPKKLAEEEAPADVLPGLEDAAAADGDKEALRDTLEQADAQRRSNRCDTAMALYRQAFDMSGPDNERAQARAGYGLCLQSQGEDGDAQKYFEFAGRLSPGIDGWIKRERGEVSYSKKAARPAKPRPVKKAVAEPLK